MRPSRLAALLLLIQPTTASAQGTCSPGDTTRVREQLVTQYATFRAAFMNNAPQAWISALDSSFTLTLFSGTIMPESGSRTTCVRMPLSFTFVLCTWMFSRSTCRRDSICGTSDAP